MKKIISGGQTGADRAGLDAAIGAGIEYGGWLPRGRKAEDGIVPVKYDRMRELSRGGYPKRTEQNVIDSDGTVIFTFGRPTGGSALTRRMAVKHNKPWLHIDLENKDDAVLLICDWLVEREIEVLNVAGSRESRAPGIYKKVRQILKTVLKGNYHERK